MTTHGQPVPADPTAVIGRRIAAYIIDIVILTVITVIVALQLGASQDVPTALDAEVICDQLNNTDSGYFCINADATVFLFEDNDVATILAVAFIYFIATQLILPAATGFSPGKAMVGLRVVAAESFQKAGFGAQLIRWLLWIVDAAPWCFPLVGLITGLSSKGHRRVGDMAAGTLVIDKQWMGTPLAVPGVNSVPPAAAAGAPLFPPPPGATPPPPPTTMPPAPPSGSAIGAPIPPPASMAPPATPPVSSPPPSAPPSDPPDDDATTALIAPLATPPAEDAPAPEAPGSAEAPPPPSATEPPPPPAPPSAPRPGVDAPQWDEARDTYIQWDPELSEWMEWSESSGAWIPISK